MAGSGSGSGSRFNRNFLKPPSASYHIIPIKDPPVVEKIYLVPYRWWMMIRSEDDVPSDREIALYVTSPEQHDSGKEIRMNLERIEPPSSDADKDKEAFTGSEIAFVPEFTWLRALVRHNYLKSTKSIDDASLFGEKDFLDDVITLHVTLIVSAESNTLVVKIRREDKTVTSFKRAYILFTSYFRQLHIWDFSGKTTQFYMNGKINLPKPGQLNKEVQLELYFHGFSGVKGPREEIAENHSRINGGSSEMNIGSDNVNQYFNSIVSCRSDAMYRGVGSLGLTGLDNLGNTCYMNSAIQCLVHTPKLVDYFLGDYERNMNRLENEGELAYAFGELLRKLWVPGATTVNPINFNQKLEPYAPKFRGNNQQDSQELLTYLLNGLHGDLNKPYFEAIDAESRPDKEKEDQTWQEHFAHNNSIIHNTFLGQHRSKLVCPDCNKVSITFGTFMQLPVPIPKRPMALTVLSTDGAALPTLFTVTMPSIGKILDVTDALSVACSLKDDETLLVAEIYQGRIHHFLEDPSALLSSVTDVGTLVAYRLPKDLEQSQLVLYVHQEREKLYNLHPIGIPFLAVVPNSCHGSVIREKFVDYLIPFLKLDEDMSEVLNVDSETDWETMGGDSDFEFRSADASMEIKMDQLVDFSNLPVKPRSDILEVLVSWSEKMVMKYDTRAVTFLPKVSDSSIMSDRSVSLYECLEAYQKEELLDHADMWRCPRCMIPRRARKKLDLWRLPEILVIQINRFPQDRKYTGKLETLVDFPLYDLDISGHITSRYMLYAICNHYGNSMDHGHYTAFVQVGGKGSWYEFNDARVCAVDEDTIKTSEAYLLFYRRVPDPGV